MGRPGLGAGADPARARMPTAVTGKAGSVARWVSPTLLAILAASLLRVFTLEGDTGVHDTGPLAEAGRSD